MKGFRRFGGEFSGNGDPGNFAVATIGIILLVAFCVAALTFDEPWFVGIGFSFLFCFTVLSTFFSGGVGEGMLKQRFAKQLSIADLQREAGNFEGCLRALEKAQRYGELPTQYAELYDEAKQNIEST